MSRTQQQRSINRLLREYPKLQELYAPLSPEHAPDIYPGVVVNARISVQRADPNLMYWQPANIGGRRGAHLWSMDGLCGERREMCILYDRNGHRMFEESEDVDADLAVRHSYLEAALFGSDSLYKRLGHVVILRQTYWYDQAPTDQGEFEGTLKRIDASITLYKQPRDTKTSWGTTMEGWCALAETTDVRHNVTLSGGMLFAQPDFGADWFRELTTIIGQYAQNFERLVWHRGFGKIVDDSTKKGMSGMFGDTKVSSYVMAGRVMVQLDRGDVSFTMIGEDNVQKPRFGFQSVYGTADELSALVDDAIIFWTTADEQTRQACHHDDTNVSIF